ncbi:MAG: hypothetical protein AB7P21_20415 [Lautropia sp.]
MTQARVNLAPSATIDAPDAAAPHDVAPSRTLTVVWQVSPDAILETDTIVELFERTGHRIESVIDLHHRWIGPGAVIVSDGLARDGIEMRDYLARFRALGLPVAVMHVADEFAQAPVDFYPQAAFVLRQCWRSEVMSAPNVVFVPIGYKKGFREHVEARPIAQRRYQWVFAGCVRGRLSRRAMAWHAKRIPGGLISESGVFNDSSSLGFPEYVKLLCDAKFCLAPGGNRLPETYRFYEALIAGAIPVVEVVTAPKLLWTVFRDLVSAPRRRTYGTFTRRYWRDVAWWLRHPDFWTEVFGPDFPCPRVRHWRELPDVVARTDVVACAAATTAFWEAWQARLHARVATLATERLLEPAIVDR